MLMKLRNKQTADSNITNDFVSINSCLTYLSNPELMPDYLNKDKLHYRIHRFIEDIENITHHT